MRAGSPESDHSFLFDELDDLEVSMPVDDAPGSKMSSSGIKSPPRTTKGKYHWSPETGWRKEEEERIVIVPEALF